MSGRAWTAEDDERIRELAARRLSWKAIAEELGASKTSVEKHANRIGVVKPSPTAWLPEEDARLRELWDGRSLEAVATELGRSPEAVRKRAQAIGLIARRPATKKDRTDHAPANTAPPAPNLGTAWDWKEGRFIWRHRDEPAAALAAALGRTEEEVEKIVAAMDAAERRGTC